MADVSEAAAQIELVSPPYLSHFILEAVPLNIYDAEAARPEPPQDTRPVLADDR
jgi:hypothetical protein